MLKNRINKNFENYDYYVVLSHFKGHAMAGYDGAIKKISIGIVSPLCMYGMIRFIRLPPLRMELF
ncbi:MAG: DUF362 domain-containing protein [Clostridiales bacterium]|nr:DUF362 domain-containing protein [Clostridiales bacterium]